MEQPWWVYALIASVCAVAWVGMRIIESRVLKGGYNLGFAPFVVGFLAVFAAYQAAVGVGLFP